MHCTVPAAAAFAAIAISNPHAFAGVVASYDVGTGTSTSTIQVDFTNGNAYQVTLRWDTAMNGFDALQAALPGVDFGFGVGRFEEYANFGGESAAGRPFILNQPIVASGTAGFSLSIQSALDRMAPGFGGDGPETDIEALYQLVTGIGFDADYEYGNGDLWPIENYWHYWTEVNGQWEMAMFGASDRMLVDGSKDAWVFGSSDAPQAVPAPGAAEIGVVCMWHRFRRKRR